MSDVCKHGRRPLECRESVESDPRCLTVWLYGRLGDAERERDKFRGALELILDENTSIGELLNIAKHALGRT